MGQCNLYINKNDSLNREKEYHLTKLKRYCESTPVKAITGAGWAILDTGECVPLLVSKDDYQIHGKYSKLEEYESYAKYLCDAHPYLHIDLVSYDSFLIRFIDRPSEDVQLAAVTHYPKSIAWISNPSREVQMRAVRGNILAIQGISSPHEDAQLYAVMENWTAIQYIREPSERVQMEAVKRCTSSYNNIIEPADSVHNYIAGVMPSYLRRRKVPKETQFLAIKKNLANIVYLNYPDIDVQLYAVKQSPDIFYKILNPDKLAEDLHKKLWGFAVYV